MEELLAKGMDEDIHFPLPLSPLFARSGGAARSRPERYGADHSRLNDGNPIEIQGEKTAADGEVVCFPGKIS
jgi:hypothetical protein